MNKKFLIVILRFHGDVLLTKPMIDNIKLNVPDSEIDLLVYKGTGSILEHERNVSEIIEIDKCVLPNPGLPIKKGGSKFGKFLIYFTLYSRAS